jgi:hypothetical protein
VSARRRRQPEPVGGSRSFNPYSPGSLSGDQVRAAEQQARAGRCSWWTDAARSGFTDQARRRVFVEWARQRRGEAS